MLRHQICGVGVNRLNRASGKKSWGARIDRLAPEMEMAVS